MLEIRAKTDEAAAAGQAVVQDFLTDPDAGTVYRSVPLLVKHKATVSQEIFPRQQ